MTYCLSGSEYTLPCFKHRCLTFLHTLFQTPDKTTHGSLLEVFIDKRRINKKAFLIIREGFVGYCVADK